MIGERGWTENSIYPGTHWLYYNERGDYKARIDFQPWTKSLFMWRVMSNSIFTDDIVGFEYTLEGAKETAIKALMGGTYQPKLIIPEIEERCSK